MASPVKFQVNSEFRLLIVRELNYSNIIECQEDTLKLSLAGDGNCLEPMSECCADLRYLTHYFKFNNICAFLI